jgi:hypothetical protein
MYLISPQFFLFSITSAKVRHYSFFATIGKGLKKLSFHSPLISCKKNDCSEDNRGRERNLGCMLLPFLSKLGQGRQKTSVHFAKGLDKKTLHFKCLG